MSAPEVHPPPDDLSKSAHVPSEKQYEELYKQSIEDPEKFWGNIASSFHWNKKWSSPVTR